jgi:hypothetical protein
MEGSFTGEYEAHVKQSSGNEKSLSIQAPMGNLEGVGFNYRRLYRRKRGLYKWSLSLHGSSVKGTWRESNLTGISESYI